VEQLPLDEILKILCPYLLHKRILMNKPLLYRRQLLYLGLGVAGAGTAAMLGLRLRKTTAADENRRILPGRLAAASPRKSLPEFQGISQWLNSPPLAIADLKGKVVLVQFWTFSCINCQRTLPYITRWHRQYTAQGLTIIGVHTPEFAFEREATAVKKALQQHQITYAVALDNAYKTWSAYSNNYWPHLFLADRQGVLRYDHIGEGAYDTTERTIRQLLA
jgi:thiol-disulfide isomerase/thioredoxin